MAAAACFTSIGVQADQQREILQSAHQLYAESLHGLTHGSAKFGILPEEDENVLRELRAVRALWEEFSHNIEITMSGDPAAALVLMELSVPILKQSDAVVKALVASRGTSGDLSPKLAQTIDLAGRQRMLSQRIAKSACAIQAAKFPQAAAEELATSRTEFEAALVALERGSDTTIAPPTAEIRAQLAIVRGKWDALQAALEQILSGALLQEDEIAAVADRTSELLQAMNKAVGMYAESA